MPSSMTQSVPKINSKAIKAPMNFDWPFPDFRKPHQFWKLKSRYCIWMVGMIAGRTILSLMNSTVIRNKEILLDAIFKRPKGVPLITVANHESCMDDPGLIGLVMSSRQLADQERMRWSLAAHDICFTRSIYSTFFSHGKCIPTVRGLGVYQRSVDFVINRMNEHGDWIHLFPEGKVNMEREKLYRLKWGVGRMIAECQTTPIVIPFWHTGMSDVLPNYKPYIPRFGKKVFVNVGQPLQIQPVLDIVREKSALDKRKIITDFIQMEMEKLQKETLELSSKKAKETAF